MEEAVPQELKYNANNNNIDNLTLLFLNILG